MKNMLAVSLDSLEQAANARFVEVILMEARGRGVHKEVMLMDRDRTILAHLRVYQMSIEVLNPREFDKPDWVKKSEHGGWWVHVKHPKEFDTMAESLVKFYVDKKRNGS